MKNSFNAIPTIYDLLDLCGWKVIAKSDIYSYADWPSDGNQKVQDLNWSYNIQKLIFRDTPPKIYGFKYSVDFVAYRVPARDYEDILSANIGSGMFFPKANAFNNNLDSDTIMQNELLNGDIILHTNGLTITINTNGDTLNCYGTLKRPWPWTEQRNYYGHFYISVAPMLRLTNQVGLEIFNDEL